MSQRVRVAAASEIPLGKSKEVAAAGRIIALFNVDGAIYALDGICPHAGGPLGNGTLENGKVTCPWHGWQFEVSSGQHCLSPNIRNETFAVTIENDDVFIEVPD